MAETNDTVLNIPAEDLDLGGGAPLEYAGFWSRVAALIVDNAIVTILGLALLIAAGSVGGAEAVAIANLAFILIAFLYWPLLECSERQATLGKQLLGIQVTDVNGARLTFVRSLLRNLAKIISSLPFGLGFLLAAFTARRQALHDLITNCLVVRAGPSHFLKAVIATVGAILITIGGGYYYFTEFYMPQMAEETGRQMAKEIKPVQKAAPPAQPVAKAPAPAPAPQPAPAAPDAPKPMTPQEIAEFEKKVAAEIKPAPVKPEPAPVVKEAAPKPAAAPAAAAKPEAKPAAPATEKPKPETKLAAPAAEKPKPEEKPAVVAVAKPKPKPAPAAPAALVSEPPPAPPARPAEARAPAAPAPVAAVSSARPVRSPKFNDVMTAVMYRDPPAVAELLELGWWVDRPDSNGVTPLMAAAWIGDATMTRILLKAGADPNRRGPGGSVLNYAGRGGDALVIDVLRSSGAR